MYYGVFANKGQNPHPSDDARIRQFGYYIDLMSGSIITSETIESRAAAGELATNRVPVWVMPLVTAAVIAVDAILAALSFVLAFKIRDGNQILSQTAWAWSRNFVPYSGILLLAVPIRVLMLWYQGAFRFYGAFSFMQEMIKVFKAVLVGSLLIVAWAFLFRGGYSFRDFSYSRGIFIIDFAIAVSLFTAFHLALRYAQSVVRQRGINLAPTIVVGTNSVALRTIAELGRRRYLGYRMIGVVETAGSPPARVDTLRLDDGRQLPVLGNVDELAELVKKYRIQEVIIADETVESERLFEAMMGIGRSQRVEFRIAPSLFDLLPQKTSVEQIGVLPMVRLFTEPLSDAQRFVKRASDIVTAIAALVITSPIWLVIAVLIRRDSPGPIFFRQERVGMDGRIFLCLKFRTMHVDADEDLHRESYRQNIAGTMDEASVDDRKPAFGKVPNDPRITKVGRRLRRYSFDELPQLINVLQGQMSIVGPRPPIPYEVHDYDIWHRKRLDMKPGITGLWQVSGRNRLTFDEMVRADLYYIENWSIWLDLKIILLTIPALWRDDGAV
jgi:exopolysaccharide biosynthesis polyprenyl glycosylphosphotransferase